MSCWKRIFFDNPLVLLDQFAEYTDEGRLRRLSYNTWRNIKSLFLKADADNCQVGFEYDEDGHHILMGLSKRDVGNYDPDIIDGIYTDDNSFGEFITNFLDGMNLPWKNSEPMYVRYVDETSTVGEPITVAPITSKTCTIGDDLVVKGKIINENIERESNNMKFNFDFGTCEGDNIRVSPYGIAIRNATGTWVSYDTKSGNLIDVDIFNFNGGKYLFKMPVAIKDVKVGDIVIHNHIPCFVKGVTDGTVVAIDPYAGEEKSILFTKTPFGFDFVTKVVCLFDNMFNGASNDNPFGNMLPFFLMSNSDSKGNDMDPLLMAMLLNGGNAAAGFQNPMMLALMCADQTNMCDVLPLMLLAGQGNNPVTTAAN